jgi:hypothetical protein
MLQDYGALRSMTGSYTGNETKGRTIDLGVAPKLLFLYDTVDGAKRITMADGVKDKDSYSYWDGAASHDYQVYVSLSGSVLTFGADTYQNYPAVHFNESGRKYKWVAIY